MVTRVSFVRPQGGRPTSTPLLVTQHFPIEAQNSTDWYFRALWHQTHPMFVLPTSCLSPQREELSDEWSEINSDMISRVTVFVFQTDVLRGQSLNTFCLVKTHLGVVQLRQIESQYVTSIIYIKTDLKQHYANTLTQNNSFNVNLMEHRLVLGSLVPLLFPLRTCSWTISHLFTSPGTHRML